MMTEPILKCLLTGSVELLQDEKTFSAIAKKSQTDALFLTKTGFENDQQADHRHHGGLEKAVHHYAFQHYKFWKDSLGATPLLEKAGAFGENFSTSEMDESTVSVGDVFRLGSALIEVSQGRQPCFKLNIRFANKAMSRLVQENGRTGWYYRVLEEGKVCAGDRFILVDRKAEDWSLHRIWHIFYVDCLNRQALQAIAKLDCLSDSWRQLAQKRLDKGEVENWEKRLEG